jgi:hypothetical protein
MNIALRVQEDEGQEEKKMEEPDSNQAVEEMMYDLAESLADPKPDAAVEGQHREFLIVSDSQDPKSIRASRKGAYFVTIDASCEDVLDLHSCKILCAFMLQNFATGYRLMIDVTDDTTMKEELRIGSTRVLLSSCDILSEICSTRKETTISDKVHERLAVAVSLSMHSLMRCPDGIEHSCQQHELVDFLRDCSLSDTKKQPL